MSETIHFGGMGDLGKALTDPFNYAVCIRDGWVIFCESLSECGHGWYRAQGIRLVVRDGRPLDTTHQTPGSAQYFERGITFPRTSIIWVADAPDGS